MHENVSDTLVVPLPPAPAGISAPGTGHISDVAAPCLQKSFTTSVVLPTDSNNAVHDSTLKLNNALALKALRKELGDGDLFVL